MFVVFPNVRLTRSNVTNPRRNFRCHSTPIQTDEQP